MFKILFGILISCGLCFGASPTFNSFNGTQFGANASQNNVSVSDGAVMTNTVQKTVFISGRRYVQDNLTGTNNAIDFNHYSIWNIGASSAVRFNLANIPLEGSNSVDCVITIIGGISSVFTNVVDSITWMGPWGQLNATNNTVTIRWDGTNLLAWQDPMHGVVVKTQITSTQNDYDCGVADEVRINSDVARTITGIVGRPGGQYLILENTGSFAITLANQNAGSVATNRFLLAQDISLEPHQGITLTYSVTASRWKVTDMNSVTEPNLMLSDVTTANVTTAKHGLTPKGDGVSTHYLDGTLAWSSPTTASPTIYNCTLTGATNTVSEVSLWSNNVAIPAGVLGTNRLCRVFIEGDMLNNAAATTCTRTYKLYVGGTSVFTSSFVDPALTAGSALRVPWEFTIDIQNLNSTAIQEVSARYIEGARGVAAPDSGTLTSAALVIGKRLTQTTKDSTADISLAFTVTMSNNDPATWIEKFRVVVIYP